MRADLPEPGFAAEQGQRWAARKRGWSVRVQVMSGVEVESRSAVDVVWSEAGNDLSLRLSNFSSQNSIMNPLAILEFKGPIGRLSTRRHRCSLDWMLAHWRQIKLRPWQPCCHLASMLSPGFHVLSSCKSSPSGAAILCHLCWLTLTCVRHRTLTNSSYRVPPWVGPDSKKPYWLTVG